MRLLPAIDLREGETVQLIGGDPSNEAVRHDDPVQVACRWVEQGASMLHVVDLDAALGTGSNVWVVDQILRTLPQPVQFGGGVRSLLDIQKRIEMGVGRVIVGTQGIKEQRWLEEACMLFPDKIVLAIDARGDEVAVKGWQEGSGLKMGQVLERVSDLDLAALLYTNIDVEGQMTGVDRAAVEDVVSNTGLPVIASGGIGSMADLDVLKDCGVDAAVLGMSIYTGKIDLRKAIERIEGREVPRGRAVLVPKGNVQWGDVPEDTPSEQIVRAPGAADADAGPMGNGAGVAGPTSAQDTPRSAPGGSVWRRRKKTTKQADAGDDAATGDDMATDDDGS